MWQFTRPKSLILIHNQTEGRIRRTCGPAHFPVHYINSSSSKHVLIVCPEFKCVSATVQKFCCIKSILVGMWVGAEHPPKYFFCSLRPMNCGVLTWKGGCGAQYLSWQGGAWGLGGCTWVLSCSLQGGWAYCAKCNLHRSDKNLCSQRSFSRLIGYPVT